MSFFVDPEVPIAAARDFEDLSAALGEIYDYVASSPQPPPDTGTVYFRAAQKVIRTHRSILSKHTVGGRARSVFDRAADTHVEIARDYRNVDDEVAARFDAEIPGSGLSHNGRPGGVAHGIDRGSISAHLTPPTDLFDGFEDWQALSDFVKRLSTLTSLDSLSSAIGLGYPVQEAIDELAGDWEQVGKGLDVVSKTALAWSAIAHETFQIRFRFGDGAWSGNAADKAADWVHQLGTSASTYSEAIKNAGKEIGAEAHTVRAWSELGIKALGELLEIINELGGMVDTLDKLHDPAKQIKFFTHLVKLLDRAKWVMYALDGLIAACMSLTALLAQLYSEHVAFPDVPGLALDVDGP